MIKEDTEISKKNNTKSEKDLYVLIARLVLIMAFVVMVAIAMLSEFGVHPDEYDVRYCMDWAESHWIWPDMRLQGTGLGDTYSWYGYTKLSNYTIYFLVMSKISFLFRLFMGTWPYYRMPNLLLALLLLIVMLKNVKTKRYLMLGFGICVQAWYIFSYVTADALDFVWGFIAIYLLADDDGFLWKTVLVRAEDKASCAGTDGASAFIQEEKAAPGHGRFKTVLRCILLGLLYGMILLGKPYYYSLLVLTFVVLLIKLVEIYRTHTGFKTVLTRYLMILGVAVLVYVARAGLDFHYYGFEKSAVEEEMMEIYANYDKKPSTPIEEQEQSYHAYEKGYPLSYIFECDPWVMHTYRSFVSSRLTTYGEEPYFVVIGALYLAIFGWMGVAMWRDGSGGAASSKALPGHNRIIFITGCLLMVGGVVASIVNSYLIDVQPQGRYLLPIPLIVCYLGSRTDKLWNKSLFRGFVLAAGVLSLMYFEMFDSRALIDLSYVRSLFG